MAKVLKPPSYAGMRDIPWRAVFLAGSIEMGAAVNWQTQVEEALKDCNNMVLFNPRRDDWDDTWEQTIKNAQFVGQVKWELEAMERANIIAMYFDPNTKSPITLLEFGLHARSGKLVVCCPDGFYRKGNVDVVCQRYNIMQVPSLKSLISYLKRDDNDNEIKGR